MATTKRADFEAVFPSLVEDLKAAATQYGIPDNALQWFEKVILLSVLFTFRPLHADHVSLFSPSTPTPPAASSTAASPSRTPALRSSSGP